MKHDPFSSVISTIQTDRLFQRGYQGYLAYVIDSRTEETKIDNIPVIRYFVDAS